jgi:hypothetical protein
MDVSLQDRRVLEAQGRVMLQAMMQAHIDPRRRRSSASRSGMARPSRVPESDETLGLVEPGSGKSSHLAKEHERTHQSRYADITAANPLPPADRC